MNCTVSLISIFLNLVLKNRRGEGCMERGNRRSSRPLGRRKRVRRALFGTTFQTQRPRRVGAGAARTSPPGGPSAVQGSPHVIQQRLRRSQGTGNPSKLTLAAWTPPPHGNNKRPSPPEPQGWSSLQGPPGLWEQAVTERGRHKRAERPWHQVTAKAGRPCPGPSRDEQDAREATLHFL